MSDNNRHQKSRREQEEEIVRKAAEESSHEYESLLGRIDLGMDKGPKPEVSRNYNYDQRFATGEVYQGWNRPVPLTPPNVRLYKKRLKEGRIVFWSIFLVFSAASIAFDVFYKDTLTDDFSFKSDIIIVTFGLLLILGGWLLNHFSIRVNFLCPHTKRLLNKFDHWTCGVCQGVNFKSLKKFLTSLGVPSIEYSFLDRCPNCNSLPSVLISPHSGEPIHLDGAGDLHRSCSYTHAEPLERPNHQEDLSAQMIDRLNKQDYGQDVSEREVRIHMEANRIIDELRAKRNEDVLSDEELLELEQKINTYKLELLNK